ncbi:MAG TPA: N-acetylmuramoyl-L-alanine amidase [Victivallales bacterium]|nr:N-acetylmuramoyl-L-alanine amidase [Victivallales bacterium]
MKKPYLAVFIIMPLFFLCSLNALDLKTTWFNGKKYVYLKDIARYYGMNLSTNKKYANLTSRYSNLKFTYNSKKGEINNTIVYYLYAPAYISGQPIINIKDFQYIIEPILRSKALKKQNVKTVIIDPGHGGKDRGAKGRIVKEKDITLKIAKKLADILSVNGFKVIITRNRDVYKSLNARPALASYYNADIFISIHCNSAASNVKGIETYIYPPAGTPSTSSIRASSYKRQNGDLYAVNSARLGYEIQKSLLRTGSPDRGVKHARFAVLRLSKVPSVLIETGFLSSTSEEIRLNSYNYQKKLASYIADGIIKYKQAVSQGT